MKGQQFIWVGSAYALGSTALVPLCGGLAQVRQQVLLVKCRECSFIASPSPLDHRATAHHIVGTFSLCPWKCHMWCCIEFDDACCRKRFSLSLPDGIATYSNHNPIAVQGLGAGAITSSVHIILSDLITLRERGTYGGLMGLCVVLLFLDTC